MSLNFADPPPRRRRPKYMTPEVCAELRANPGRWALLAAGVTPSARQAVREWCIRHPGYEMTQRSAGSGPYPEGAVQSEGPVFDIYVRWAGE